MLMAKILVKLNYGGKRNAQNILNVLSDDNTRKEIDVNRSFFIKDQYGIPENEPAEILSKLLEHLSQ